MKKVTYDRTLYDIDLVFLVDVWMSYSLLDVLFVQ